MAEKQQDRGLTDEQVAVSREKHGSNTLDMQEDRLLGHILREIVIEPMFILLLIACFIYFVVGQYQEGIIMAVSIVIVAGISFFQEYRSRNAVQALRKLAAPRATVRRNGVTVQVPATDVVVGDIMLVEEGEVPAADALILSANDLSLNESILTGEAFPVQKFAGNNATVYKGTLVTSGSATVEVSAVGGNTMFGKIGLSLREINVIRTPLQKQVRSFVRNMVWAGAAAFLLVVAYNYYQSRDLLHAFMHGLTLAMSILPEEIPVAFSTFQALGAFRLLRNQVIVKQPQYVETLGSATVICADKTGTLTQNRMEIAYLYDPVNHVSVHRDELASVPHTLVEYAMWSSETEPFDPMEKAIHDYYTKTSSVDKRYQYRQVHEYPVGGRPPMMTHIFESTSGDVLIAAKGAPEAILYRSALLPDELERMEAQSLEYARKGYRVLGVGRGIWNEGKWPVSQEEFTFEFLGLIAFHDPPKENVAETIRKFNDAGIQLKIITGDYAETTMAIARQVGLQHNGRVLLGNEVLQLTPVALQQQVKDVNIFARMFPEAKMRVIEALIGNGEVVAMTGDGVNDGPALKAAHIGIAMGSRGSEVARAAASLVLGDDDISHMADAVALGRKIYDNLRKAIRYIVSIHIPIILIVTLPLLLMWRFTDIFSPVHVIFLELIMGPTCSIIYENEPIEPGTMQRPPRKMGNTFLSFKQLAISILQGFAITAACLLLGNYYLQQLADETYVRSVIFITLLFANIFLTLVNRSFHYTVFTTIRYRNYMVPLIILLTLLFIATLILSPFMQQLFMLKTLPLQTYLVIVVTALASVCWIELLKPVYALAMLEKP